MSHDLCQLSNSEMSDHFPANLIHAYSFTTLFSPQCRLKVRFSGSASQKPAERMIRADARLLREQACLLSVEGGLHS